MFKKIIAKNRSYWSQKEFLNSSLLGLLLFILSLFINYIASVYATEKASNWVTDIILSNTRVWDVDSIFVYGALLLIAFIIFLGVINPNRLPSIAYTFALFFLIRAIFMSLTHLGPFPEHVILNHRGILEKLFSGGDMFFSAHTGAPFLMALIFWDKKFLRYLFLVWTVIFATVVLLGHLHYSIDVLAAFFITYTIFEIAKKLFSKSYQMIEF
jgi:divalent metal cation (Fe/Co/Zn/Cd) transporter